MRLKILFFALLLSVFYSCSDIFEHDLAGDLVQIYSPANNDTSKTYIQQFWWNSVDKATKYNLQIATPAFDGGTFILDSTTTKNKVVYSLNPGKYQWRVRAENGSSQTGYITYNLSIDSGNVGQQTVNLKSPDPDIDTNKAMQNLTWQEIFGATVYAIKIDSGASFNDIVYQTTIPAVANPSYVYTFPKDGTYKWSVKAGNGNTFSNPGSRIFKLDTVKPDTATSLTSTVITSPTSKINLSWTGVDDAAYYLLYIYKGTTSFGSPFMVPHTGATIYDYDSTLGVPGDILTWYVVVVDSSGNKSNASSKKTFTAN